MKLALEPDGAAWCLRGPVGLGLDVVLLGAAGLRAVTGALADGAAGASVTAFLTERMALSTEAGWLALGCPLQAFCRRQAWPGGPVAIA